MPPTSEVIVRDSLLSGTLASYGASAVARTSDRGRDHHDPRDQLDRICPRTIHDHRRRATHGSCKVSTTIPSISQESTPEMVRTRQCPPRHRTRLRRRFLRRHPRHPLVFYWLRLPHQRRCHLVAVYQDPAASPQRRRSGDRQPQLSRTRMPLSPQTLPRNGLSPTYPNDHLRRLRSSCRTF